MKLLRVRSILAAALVCVALPVFGCVNTFDMAIRAALLQGRPELADQIVADLKKAHSSKPTLENSNDLGVAWLLTGKIDDAIALFRETEKKYPGSAKVAANLGTALELKGNDDEALTWIREGFKRDANEHWGSEWLHVRILKAKLALKEDPKWFAKNHVLDLDFGRDEVPVAPEILPIENGTVKGAEQLIDQIAYQLRERTKFVKAPDAVVGDLYASAGDLAIASGLTPLDQGFKKASAFPEEFYENAIRYGAPHADLVRKRLARYLADVAKLPPPAETKDEVADYPVVNKRFAPPPESSRPILFWLLLGALATGLLVAIGWVIDRIQRKRADAIPRPPLPDVD